MSAGMSEKLNNATATTQNAFADRLVSVATGKRLEPSAEPNRGRNSLKRNKENQTRKAVQPGRWARILRMLAIGTTSRDADALPICSFGPGGSYLVDWRASDSVDFGRRSEARTIAAGIERIAESLTLDLKGWLLAEHPERSHRIDAAPETLDSCPCCGNQNQWPDWFIKGQPAPDQQVVIAGLRVAEDLKVAVSSDPVAAAVVEQARAKRSQEFAPCPETSETAIQDAGFNISAAIGLAEMKSDLKKDSERNSSCLVGKGSDAARTDVPPEPEKIDYSEGSWETENTGPFLFRFSDNLEPVSFRLPTVREQSHDTDTKAAQNPDHNSGLSSSERILANHAGAGRSAQRLKGHHIRARRGARTERAATASPEQGSLFGDQSDGQAA